MEPNIEYHIVELKWVPDEVYQWCSQQFGRAGTRWFVRTTKIYFKNKLDHIMFLMRWS